MDISEICQRMKKRRLSLNLSIETVSSATKLPPTVINDIENGNMENISPVYLKGFLKIYAGFLKDKSLIEDIEEAFSLQKQSKVKKEPVSAQRPAKIRKPVSKGKKVSLPFIKKTAVLVLILAVFLLAKGIFSRHSKPASESPGISAVKPIQPKRHTSAKNVLVGIKIRKKCFIKAKVDKVTLFEGIMLPNAVKSWQAKKTVELFVNNPSFIDLEANGDYIDTSKNRQPAIYIFTPSGFSVKR